MKTFVAFTTGFLLGPIVIVSWAWWKIGEENRTYTRKGFKRTWVPGAEASESKIDPESYVTSVTYKARQEQEVVDWILFNWNGATPESAWNLFNALRMDVGDRLQVDFEGGLRVIVA